MSRKTLKEMLLSKDIKMLELQKSREIKQLDKHRCVASYIWSQVRGAIDFRATPTKCYS